MRLEEASGELAPHPKPPEPVNPVLLVERLFANHAAPALASQGQVLWLLGRGHTDLRLAELEDEYWLSSILRRQRAPVLAIGGPGQRCDFAPQVILGALPCEPGIPEPPKGQHWVETQLLPSELWEVLELGRRHLGFRPLLTRLERISVLYLAPDDR